MRVVSGEPSCEVASWPSGLVDVYVERRSSFVRLAYLLTGQPAVAEELVHDAFIATLKRWDVVREPGAYVRAAVVNHCRSWGRRRGMEERHAPAPAAPAELDADELWDALGRLDDRRRAAIVLRYYEDLSDADIAAVLGCRPGTVRSAIHRGLKELRQEIDR